MPDRNNRGNVTLRGVTRTAVTIERLVKHVSADMKSRNNIKALFSVRSVPRSYKKGKENDLSQLS
jgi:hypothetical protein